MKATARGIVFAAALTPVLNPLIGCGGGDETPVEEIETEAEAPSLGEEVEEASEPAPPEPPTRRVEVQLTNGFMPDPWVVEGSTIASESIEGEGCAGFFDPDGGVELITTGVFAELHTLATGAEGLRIALRPEGSSAYQCSSDPTLVSELGAGRHMVHVLTTTAVEIDFRLAFTELEAVTLETVAQADVQPTRH